LFIDSISSFIKPDVNTNILKTEILSIYVTGRRFPRVVRVPPRPCENICSCGYSSQTNCSQFVLCGVTPGHTFPAGVAALHSNQMSDILNKFKEIHFKYSCFIHQKTFIKLICLHKFSSYPHA